MVDAPRQLVEEISRGRRWSGRSVVEQRSAGNDCLVGLMLGEIFAKQPEIRRRPSQLKHGVSITTRHFLGDDRKPGGCGRRTNRRRPRSVVKP